MNRPQPNLLPVVISGGSGSRLWPVSRALSPKPFMAMPDGETLLAKCFSRANRLSTHGDVVLVTNREFYFQSQDQFARTCPNGRLHAILEPAGRNTAPAIAMAALYAAEIDPNAILLVLPADQLVSPMESLTGLVAKAAEIAVQGRIVTFGIAPRSPETGFGYIEIDKEQPILGGYAVQAFKEKPDHETACRFVADGRHLWNSGMFCMSVATILAELRANAPDLMAIALETWQTAHQWRDQTTSGGSRFELAAGQFGRMPDLSIDFAVIEKTRHIAVVTGDLNWSDVGTWGAISALTSPDDNGNRVIGEAILQDTRNTFIQSDDRLIATIGVSDLIVIDTSDALLIAAKDKSQEVKAITELLRQSNHEAHKLHRTVRRPWGTYTILTEAANFKVKSIVVFPDNALSLQLHHHRSEHWVVISGVANVTIEQTQAVLHPGQSIYIPAGSKHRLENRGSAPLAIIEVQTGTYLGEDDIVRFADDYGRLSTVN